MTKEIRSPNVEKLSAVRSPVSSFGFPHSFGFCHSSFGFENFSLFNQKAGQRAGESGRGWSVRESFHAIPFQRRKPHSARKQTNANKKTAERCHSGMVQLSVMAALRFGKLPANES